MKDFKKSNLSNKKLGENSKKRKEIQCYECKGYGHITVDYANRKKKSKNKAMAVMWDDDSDALDDKSLCSEDDSSLGVRALIVVIVEPSDDVE